ncbi:hypothetical protein AUJ16_02490 [Candidatus Micrarchaeota archaeon CG1_02_60_51]|nr:MAG: hypothetical protein AUJ16_02490 [Candidatus Micrarchaeota archaeon CG1_02_60_51]
MKPSKALLALFLFLPLVSAAYGDVSCSRHAGNGNAVTQCVFDAGEFDSLRDGLSLDLNALAKSADDAARARLSVDAGFAGFVRGSSFASSAQGSHAVASSAFDAECFSYSVNDKTKTLSLSYSPACQACHSSQSLSIAFDSKPSARLSVAFKIACKNVNTVFLGNGVSDSVVPDAVRVYAIDAKARGERVKFIDYSSGKALADDAGAAESENCVLPSNSPATTVRDKCVSYLKERVYAKSGERKLLLLGDPAWGGVPLLELDFAQILTGDQKDGLSPSAHAALKAPSDRAFDADWYAGLKAGLSPSTRLPDASTYLIVSRLPGEAALIARQINASGRATESKNLLMLSDSCGGDDCLISCRSKRSFEQLNGMPYCSLDRDSHADFAQSPPLCLQPAEYNFNPSTDCSDYGEVKRLMASHSLAWLAFHSNYFKSTAAELRALRGDFDSSPDWYIFARASYDAGNGAFKEFDSLPRTLFLQSCYSASFDAAGLKEVNSHGGRDLNVLRAFLRSGTTAAPVNAIGFSHVALFIVDSLSICVTCNDQVVGEYNQWTVSDPLTEVYVYARSKRSDLGAAFNAVDLRYFRQKFLADCFAKVSRGSGLQSEVSGYCNKKFADYYPDYVWSIATMTLAGVPNTVFS